MDTGIADRLRAAGLTVIECAGWQSRGSSSFSPQGSVNHHTAGPPTGATPSLNTCINGRPDLAGPLCHVMQSRESGRPDAAYVVAAGRANHAGSGSWQGLSGNSSVWGLEIEHDGVTPLPQARQETAAAIHAALIGPGGNVGLVCQHYEWTTRKIDAATGVSGEGFRQLVADAQAGRGPDPAPLPPWETYGDDPMWMMFCSGQTPRLVSPVHAIAITSGADQQALIARFGRVDVSKTTYDAVMNGTGAPIPTT